MTTPTLHINVESLELISRLAYAEFEMNGSNVRLEVFKTVSMNNAFFSDVTPCGSCKNPGFGRTYRLLHQVDKNCPDDAGDAFLRNVGSYKNHAE
jgi:hypothetical protein